MAGFRPSLKTGKNMADKKILIRQRQKGLPRVLKFCENLFSPTDSWRPTDCLNQKNQSASATCIHFVRLEDVGVMSSWDE